MALIGVNQERKMLYSSNFSTIWQYEKGNIIILDLKIMPQPGG